MAIPKKIIKQLEAFLAEIVDSDGDESPVKNEDISKLVELVGHIVAVKYDTHPDNDLPLSFNVVDGTRYHNAYFSPMPHMHFLEDDMSQAFRALQNATSNLDTARRQVESITRSMEHALKEKMEKGLTVKFGSAVYEKHLVGMTDKKAFVDTVVGALEEHMTKVPLTDAVLDNYSTKDTWATTHQNYLSKAFDTPVNISVFRARDEQNVAKVVLTLPGLAYGDGTKQIGKALRVALPGKKPKPKGP